MVLAILPKTSVRYLRLSTLLGYLIFCNWLNTNIQKIPRKKTISNLNMHYTFCVTKQNKKIDLKHLQVFITDWITVPCRICVICRLSVCKIYPKCQSQVILTVTFWSTKQNKNRFKTCSVQLLDILGDLSYFAWFAERKYTDWIYTCLNIHV